MRETSTRKVRNKLKLKVTYVTYWQTKLINYVSKKRSIIKLKEVNYTIVKCKKTMY